MVPRLLLVIGIFWAESIGAQKHDYIQLFGYFTDGPSHPIVGATEMDFNDTPPKISIGKHKISFKAQTTVCSDSSGILCFYTNGISIQNSAHNTMNNGDSINPGLIWERDKIHGYGLIGGSFALPAPKKPYHYYLFHLAMDFALHYYLYCPLYYTLIDMKSQNGLGKVVKKNQTILPCQGSYVMPAAVKHGNGRDWWIVSGDLVEPSIYLFLLDSSGLRGPFKRPVEYSFPGIDNPGFCAFSPDGRTYVRCDGGRGLYIYDFDRCSGEFYNLRVLPLYDGNRLGEAKTFLSFSPNSRYLYLSSFTVITVIDLHSINTHPTMDTIAQFDGFSSPYPPFNTVFAIPNLAPDGKIYYSTANSTLHLHVIHNPDLPGLSADVHQHGVDIFRYDSFTMSVYPNYRLGEWDGSPCDTLNGQRPGDGFTHLPYEPPRAEQRKEGYTLLPLLGKPLPAGQMPPEVPVIDFVVPREDFARWPGRAPLPPERIEKPTPDHR